VSGSKEHHVVVRSIPRTAAEVLDGLAEAGVSTVHESLGRTGYLGPQIRPIQEGAKIAGNAVTVSTHPGDNMMIHAAVEVCQPGDILVVACTGPSSHGMVGELLATSLRTRGVRGVVMDAGVRDVADLRSMGFPVWSRHISSQGTAKEKAGSVNVRVTIGEISISPGDVICADDDGVVVVPHDQATTVLGNARARLEREAVKRERLVAGELTMEMDGVRDRLVDLGVEFVDSLED